MVLGELSAESTQYGREDVTVNPIEGSDLAEQLKSAMAHINGRYEAMERVNTELDEGASHILPRRPERQEFFLYVVDGEVYYREKFGHDASGAERRRKGAGQGDGGAAEHRQ